MKNIETASHTLKLPTKDEIEIILWDTFNQSLSIPGTNNYNTSYFAVEAVIEKIKELNK